jgi:hypothetical protein
MATKDAKYWPDNEEEQKAYFDWMDEQVKNHPVVKQHHGKWQELIAWTDEGEQFSKWDSSAGKVKPVELRRRKKQVVVNLMKPLSENIDSKINITYQLVGVPNSSEANDIRGSEVATKFIGHNDYTNDSEVLFEEFKYNLVRCGNAFLYSGWEKGKFGFIKDGDKGKVKQEGDVEMRCPSVFNCRPDPLGKTREEWRWFIELVPCTKDEILDVFPDIKEADLKNAIAQKNTRYVGMNEPVDEKPKDEDEYIVRKHWERKSKKYPDGRYIISVGTLKLYAGKNPQLGEIPWWNLAYKKRGSSMWGTGPMHHVQDIQREYNRINSIVSEHIEGWRAKLWTTKGDIKEGAITMEGLEIVEGRPGSNPPTAINMPQLSSQVPAYKNELVSAMSTVSNVHEVTNSQLPKYASRAPASLYSMMLQQEDSKIDPMLKRFNRMIRDNGKFRLKLMDKYYEQERMVKLVGKNQVSSVEYFKGADLNSNYDVKLAIGISLHQNKIVQQNLFMQLYDKGIISDKNRILKMLMLGDIEQDVRGDLSDEARAERENQAFINDLWDKPFKEGGVKMYLHDNHDLHLGKHTDLMKSEEAQRWPDKKRDGCDKHIMEHFQIQMMIKQLAAGGGAKAPGAAQGQPGGMPGVGEEATGPTAADSEMGGGVGAVGPNVPNAETMIQRQAGMGGIPRV